MCVVPLYESEKVYQKGRKVAGLKGPWGKRPEKCTKVIRRPIDRLRSKYCGLIDGKEHVFGSGPCMDVRE
jgi:hypothetical protein